MARFNVALEHGWKVSAPRLTPMLNQILFQFIILERCQGRVRTF